MRVCILGLGNRHRGDDALGLLVAERLRDQELPAGVCAETAPEDPVRLLDTLARFQAVVFVDAADMGGAPGEVRVLRNPAEWESVWLPASTHGFGLQQVVALARRLGRCPPVRLVAVQAGSWEPLGPLSPQVATRLGDITRIALEEACDALEDTHHRR